MTQTLTETEINAAHKERWAEAAAEHGSPHLPTVVATKLNDRLRLDWCAFYSRDNSGAPLSRNRSEAPKPVVMRPVKPVNVVKSVIDKIVASETGDD